MECSLNQIEIVEGVTHVKLNVCSLNQIEIFEGVTHVKLNADILDILVYSSRSTQNKQGPHNKQRHAPCRACVKHKEEHYASTDAPFQRIPRL
jgi:hypothetical protein